MLRFKTISLSSGGPFKNTPANPKNSSPLEIDILAFYDANTTEQKKKGKKNDKLIKMDMTDSVLSVDLLLLRHCVPIQLL